jgi:hypothetical protein
VDPGDSSTSTTLPPGDVFDGLAANHIEDRDAATRMAAALGVEVAPRLLLWDDAPPSNRARRLWAFMGIHLRRAEEVVRSPHAYDFEHAGTLRSLLHELARISGVLVARDLPVEADRPIALRLRGTTLLGVLDEACRQAGCHGGQRARGELVVHAGHEPPYPSAYAGPMRIRIVEIRSVRSTDFASAQAQTQVRLRVEWEWPTTPLSPLRIRLHGQERSYEVTAVTNLVNVGMVAEVAIDVQPGSPLALAGTVSALFEGPYDEVRLGMGETDSAHGVSVTSIPPNPNEGGCQITIDTIDPKRIRPDITDLGLSPMILAIATSGEEGIPQVHRVRTMTSSPGSERWGLRFRDGFGAISELRLRIGAPPMRATFQFALPPVPLP